MQLQDDIDAMTAQLTEWRHDFHRHPELGYHETRTARLVAERLASFGLEVHTALGVTGVVGTLRGELGAGRRDAGGRCGVSGMCDDAGWGWRGGCECAHTTNNGVRARHITPL